MELSTICTKGRHDKGAKMRVLDEMGLETDIYIILAGQDSDLWQSIARENQQEALRRMVNKEELKSQDNTAMILNATIGWEGITQGGEPLVFSKEAALSLYDQAPFIVDQAILFISNRKNFTVS